MEHAEVNTKFTGDDSQLQKTMEAVKKAVEGIKEQIKKAADTAEWVLGLLAVEHEIERVVEHESELIRFKAALEANGVASEEWGEKLEAAALRIRDATGQTNQSIMSAMQMGLNMGVQAEKLEDMTKNAAALSAHTHMGMTQSLRMLTQAQEGHFQVFNRYIPKLRECTTDEQRLAMVNELLVKGWKEATVHTPAGEIQKLKNEFGDLTRVIGEAMLPRLIKLVEYARAVLNPIKDWVAANKELVLGIIATGAGILTAIVWGPKLLAIIESITGVITFLVTSPLSWLIAGLLALGATLAYMEGNTKLGFFERIKDGMMKVLDYLNVMFANWENFKNRIVAIWEVLTAIVRQQTNIMTQYFKDGWNAVVPYIGGIFDTIAGYLADKFVNTFEHSLTNLPYGVRKVLGISSDTKESDEQFANRWGIGLPRAVMISVENTRKRLQTEADAKAKLAGDMTPEERTKRATLWGDKKHQPSAADWAEIHKIDDTVVARGRAVIARNKAQGAADDAQAVVDAMNKLDALKPKPKTGALSIWNAYMGTDDKRLTDTMLGSRSLGKWSSAFSKDFLGTLESAIRQAPIVGGPLGDLLDAGRAGIKAREGAAETGPGGVEMDPVYEAKHKAARFEDAASMYKRIASAAAGEDPAVQVAKKQLSVAERTAAIVEAANKPLLDFMKRATDDAMGIVVKDVKGLKNFFGFQS